MKTMCAFSSLLFVLVWSGVGCVNQVNPAVARARAFVADHESRARPLEKAVALASWNANTSGKDEDFKAKEEAQNRLDAILADSARLQQVEEIRLDNWGDRFHPEILLRRQIGLLYLQHFEKQVEPALLQKMNARANAIERAFNVYRAEVGGKVLTDSEVRKVLKESKDSRERQAVWEASKRVAAVVGADLKELVRLRNQAAGISGGGTGQSEAPRHNHQRARLDDKSLQRTVKGAGARTWSGPTVCPSASSAAGTGTGTNDEIS